MNIAGLEIVESMFVVLTANFFPLVFVKLLL